MHPESFFAQLAAQPTKARPGTDEKIMILRRRAENRQELFHPEDAGLDWSGFSFDSSQNGRLRFSDGDRMQELVDEFAGEVL